MGNLWIVFVAVILTIVAVGLYLSRKVPATPTVVPENLDEPSNKYDGWEIEYHPHSGRYFPKYKGKYLYYWHTQANYTLETPISGCQYRSSKESAKAIIDRYLELQGVGTVIMKVE